jgi:acyl-CoA thioester hydrolase
MDIDFLRPAAIDDILTVRTVREAVGGARIVLEQSLWRMDQLLVRARVTVALIGPGGRAARLPSEVVAAFRR